MAQAVGTLKMPRKVAVHKMQLQAKRDTVHAYIVFKEAAAVAAAASQMNGYLFEDKHLRVDAAANAHKPVDHKRSVFVGNVPFVATDEDLRTVFAECGAVEAVRIVRDPITNVGKGFAFIMFAVRGAAATAQVADTRTHG